MDLVDGALLFGAGVLGGAINAIAGGATFFTFPAMLAVGLPPVIASASNALAVAPGHLLAAIAMRHALPRRQAGLLAAAAVGLIGGIVGALLLLSSGDAAFTVAVPFLILGATLLFAAAPALQRWLGAHRTENRGRALAIQAVTSVYGGYFGAGLGIMMLAALMVGGENDLRRANAVKNLLAAIISGVAIIIFAGYGAIAWPHTLVMLAGAMVGGYAGGRLTAVMPVRLVRVLVIATGLTLSVYYFWKLAV